MEVAILSEPERDLDKTQDNEQDQEQDNIQKKQENDQPKRKDQKFSFFEPIAGIIFAVIATVVFLGFPEIITVRYIGGFLIPTFDEVVIRSLWLPIILWAIFRIAVDVFFLIERRYTKRLSIVAGIGYGLVAICTIIIFISPRILNDMTYTVPDFPQGYISFIEKSFSNYPSWFEGILKNPHLVIMFLIISVLIIELVVVIRKGIISKDNEDEDDEEHTAEEDVDEEGASDADASDANADVENAN